MRPGPLLQHSPASKTTCTVAACEAHLLNVCRIQRVVRRGDVEHGQAGGLGLWRGAQHHGRGRCLHQHVVCDIHRVGGPKLQGSQLQRRGGGPGRVTPCAELCAAFSLC